MSLATFFKPKEKWKENYKKPIKFLSQKDSRRKGKCKQTLFNMNGTIDVNKRKSSGDINQEYNGSKKGREIPGSFTSLP